ncbi:hypothetical protein C5F49_08870 [Nitrosopumilus oxyclinae]|uniref:CBS domain-containing protein n=1 Tax=Nitrosopumilus oxyclinae TaxID=1959104 RepID=A0A7D5R9R7_9ARCH|nr:CBS domain-containing protein [Nitrosopumilus oxyclinae]QLH05422.1 hypothetical protein C5F49_08870 [Nitrosopumilus oxyclinae]
MRLNKFEEKTVGKILDHIIDKTDITVPNSIKIAEAGKSLDNKYGVLAIKDQNDKVVQVVSKSDITHILSNEITLNTSNLIKDIQTRIHYNPIKVDDNVRKVLDFIIANKIDNLVLVDKDGKYHGIINKNKLKDAIEEMVD